MQIGCVSALGCQVLDIPTRFGRGDATLIAFTQMKQGQIHTKIKRRDTHQKGEKSFDEEFLVGKK
jgi:DNA-directed RNA polymerase subunit K/omega